MTGKDIFQELGGIDPQWIEEAAPQKRLRLPRRLMALAASLIAVFCMLWAIGFDNVYAGVRELFSLIPGVGIREEGSAVYAWEPTQERLESGGMTAQILQASYLDGRLYVTVEVNGKALWAEEFAFYRNGAAQPLAGEDQTYYSLATSSDSSMLDLSVPMEQPREQDLFEVEVKGFPGRLAFRLTPCKTYEQLEQIGPTATHNGISLTATAHRYGNELVVWCYDTRWDSATQDQLLGIGQPINCGYSLTRYLETESGQLRDVTDGWVLRNRMVFRLAEGDRTATLHIPYLAMYRREKARLTLRLPETASTPELPIETSLGTVRVVSMERIPEGEDRDRICLHLAYENRSEAERMYSVDYAVKGGITDYFVVDSDGGTTAQLNITVKKGQDKVELSVSGVYYYLMEEYVLPLELAG